MTDRSKEWGPRIPKHIEGGTNHIRDNAWFDFSHKYPEDQRTIAFYGSDEKALLQVVLDALDYYEQQFGGIAPLDDSNIHTLSKMRTEFALEVGITAPDDWALRQVFWAHWNGGGAKGIASAIYNGLVHLSDVSILDYAGMFGRDNEGYEQFVQKQDTMRSALWEHVETLVDAFVEKTSKQVCASTKNDVDPNLIAPAGSLVVLATNRHPSIEGGVIGRLRTPVLKSDEVTYVDWYRVGGDASRWRRYNSPARVRPEDYEPTDTFVVYDGSDHSEIIQHPIFSGSQVREALVSDLIFLPDDTDPAKYCITKHWTDIPYGVWTRANGNEVMFNRQYKPMFEKFADGRVERIKPYWVSDIVGDADFFYEMSRNHYDALNSLDVADKMMKCWGIKPEHRFTPWLTSNIVRPADVVQAPANKDATIPQPGKPKFNGLDLPLFRPNS